MADLTRERLAWIKKHLFPPTGMTPDEWRQLCSMAERAVSSKTIGLLADAIASPGASPELRARWGRFRLACTEDLRPAAEALAKGTK